jgi:DNA-directed RNA polymerase specialized sigma24 family protein
MSGGFAGILDALTKETYDLLISPNRAESTAAIGLIRTLHPQPPSSPAAIIGHLADSPAGLAALPALARYAQTGDRHALLIATVLMRDRLRAFATASDHDGIDILTAFWTLLRTAAEPNTLTELSITHQLAKRLQRHQAAVVVEPHDPHAAVFDQAATELDCHTQAAQLLDHARTHNVITDLEYRTLTVLYLQGIGSLTVAAQILGANASAIERRAQRAIHKLNEHYQRRHNEPQKPACGAA